MWLLAMGNVWGVLLSVVSLICFCAGLFTLLYDTSVVIYWSLVGFSGMDMSVVVLFDYMSLIFCGAVLFITSAVVRYSEFYMGLEKNKARFFYLVLLFVGSMLLVILSPSFLSLLLGWDGLGLVSYCLVIYYQNSKSYSAGFLTIMSNRLGDVGLLLAIGGLMGYGSWSFYGMWFDLYWWIVWCVLLAGMTKSAQVPFAAWLPAAMAAPTPVSALVHSSTLVTAGVYLLIRFTWFVGASGDFMVVVMYIGLVTMGLAGWAAIFETDLKSVIALSTLSQLGLMMAVVGVGNFGLAFFHLITHAMFKALLFLGAGKVIHSMGGNQDLRLMGGIVEGLPLTSAMMGLASLALCGFPFLAGFYSSDLILDFMMVGYLGWFGVSLLIVGTVFTWLYSVRLIWVMMGGWWSNSVVSNLTDNDTGYTSPMGALTVGALVSGASLSWAILPLPSTNVFYSEVSLVPVVLVFLGLFGGYILSYSYVSETTSESYILGVSSGLMGLFFISGAVLTAKPLRVGESIVTLMDQGWGEIFGGQGAYSMWSLLSYYFQWIQENTIKVILMVGLGWVMLFVLV
uniref:NADH-ubiquinone oxidoreductase chain 5 n=1 Tax=Narceus annularis TaxID=174156 RepID=Q8WA96_NARAN|nr:NADH dehydrogenase subunit 5 [Narceus annularus]AAL18211.1 NADH dehydrogenase subunit 5 [Narceus annularus]